MCTTKESKYALALFELFQDYFDESRQFGETPFIDIAASLLQGLICLSISNTSLSTVTAKSWQMDWRSVLYPYCCPMNVKTS